MTISQYIALARDVFIVGALAFVAWWIYHAGGDRVRIADLKAVENQLAANSKQVDDWKAQEVAAEVRRDQEIQSVNATIARNQSPLWMCRPPDTRPVSHHPAPAEGSHSPSGPVDAGPRVDIRAAVNAFETRYESALANCRAALASWPKQ